MFQDPNQLTTYGSYSIIQKRVLTFSHGLDKGLAIENACNRTVLNTPLFNIACSIAVVSCMNRQMRLYSIQQSCMFQHHVGL